MGAEWPPSAHPARIAFPASLEPQARWDGSAAAATSNLNGWSLQEATVGVGSRGLHQKLWAEQVSRQ